LASSDDSVASFTVKGENTF